MCLYDTGNVTEKPRFAPLVTTRYPEATCPGLACADVRVMLTPALFAGIEIGPAIANVTPSPVAGPALVIDVEPDPVLTTSIVHVETPARVGTVQDTVAELIVSVAELVNVPKRPNTNPATAMAAMSVIAMRMTVASTGEMAFLFFPLCTIFIVEPFTPPFLIKSYGV